MGVAKRKLGHDLRLSGKLAFEPHNPLEYTLPDGSLVLTSEGRRFGNPGFYFTVHRPDGRVTARYLRSFRERIHVFGAESGIVRADHTMSLWGFQCLHLHNRLRRREIRLEWTSGGESTVG